MTRLVIAGAGIGGLAAALALARAGIESTVTERRDAFMGVGAGIQLSPNATRHLHSWNVLGALVAASTLPRAVRIRRGLDGAELASLPIGEAGVGAPFLLLHRADLHAVLADAAAAELHIDLRLGTEVVDIADEEGTVSVSLKTTSGADVIKADGFVDCAGLTGLKRRAGLGPDVKFSGQVAWRAMVPSDRVAHDHLRAESNLWLGPHAHLVHYPLRAGAVVNVVAIVEERRRTSAEPTDFWSEPGDGAVLLEHFRQWDRQPKALLEAAPGWHTWPLFETVGMADWSRGLQTRLGDAAHPMLPFLAQGASQAIEDAAALATAVTACPTDMAAAFRLYERRRRPRAAKVVAASRDQGRIYHLRGPLALARDSFMRFRGPQAMLARMDWLYKET